MVVAFAVIRIPSETEVAQVALSERDKPDGDCPAHAQLSDEHVADFNDVDDVVLLPNCIWVQRPFKGPGANLVNGVEVDGASRRGARSWDRKKKIHIIIIIMTEEWLPYEGNKF